MEITNNNLPFDTINNILEYKSHLTQEQWKNVYDNKTNKEKRKVNKHSSFFAKIHDINRNKLRGLDEWYFYYVYKISLLLVCLRINK